MRLQNDSLSFDDLLNFMKYARSTMGFCWMKSNPDKNSRLTGLKEKVYACALCEIAKTRHNSVFGEGNPDADIMFIGEGPGEQEDLSGRPFVGRAGKLLNKLLSSVGIKRESVYIANIIKCRPPGNRNPSESEITNCTPYLNRQIEIISPKLLFGLGKFAASYLFEADIPIGKLRGRYIKKGEVVISCSYHPAYLLRNPSASELFIDDLKKAIRCIDL